MTWYVKVEIGLMKVDQCFDIFFFKQKTAYEIYQCDWSSDVCSSDLSVFHHIAGEMAKKAEGKVTAKAAVAEAIPLDDDNSSKDDFNKFNS